MIKEKEKYKCISFIGFSCVLDESFHSRERKGSQKREKGFLSVLFQKFEILDLCLNFFFGNKP